MYLSNLDLVGFKSFAQKTDFKFSGGLTAIVGPNGCGKSNVVDAIRWVLGEQRSSVLRSESMNNVIFNGTKARKPLGMAEVSLTLQNNKNILPTEYNEVVITRRLFKSGESEYLLNNTKCRLRDILDLFMDTGIGANSYSVIELKMVEAILSGKPEERRHMIEEAAGVTRYKHKRKEASRRLQNVQNDLVRIEDLQSEKEKLVNSLKRQASKTKRYNKLLEQVKELDVKLLSNEYLHYKDEISSIKKNFNELTQKKELEAKELEDLESALSELRRKLTDFDNSYKEITDNEEDLVKKIADQNKEIAVNEEKISSQKSKKERIQNEITRAGTEIDSLQNRLEENEKNLKEIETTKSEIQKQIDIKRANISSAREIVDDSRGKVANKSEELFSIKNEKNKTENEIKRHEHNLDRIKNKIEETLNKKASILEEIDQLRSMVAEKEALKEELTERLENAETDLISGQELQDKLRKTTDELKNDISVLNAKLSSKKTSLEFYSSLAVDENEASRFLLKDENWQTSSEKTKLAELVGTDNEHRVAVNAALGESSSYFVVNTREEAIKAASILKGKDKGKASFITRELIPEIRSPQELPETKGVIGWISELVRVEDDIRNALRALLGQALMVNELENAWEAVNTKIADIAITLEGEIVSSKGVFRGGSTQKKEGIAVGKKERINKLKKEIEKISSQIESKTEELGSINVRLEEIDLRSLNETVRSSENELRENSNSVTQLNIKLESLESNIEIIEENTKGSDKEIDYINKEIKEQEEHLNDLISLVISEEEELSSLRSEMNEKEEDLNEHIRNSQETEKEYIRLEQQEKSLFREIQDYQSRIIRDKEIIDSGGKEIDECKNEILKLNAEIQKIKSSLTGLESDLEDIEIRKEAISSEISSLQEQIEQYSESERNQRKKLDRSKDEIHQKDIKLSELNSRLETISERALESYEIYIEEYEIEKDGDFSLEETRNQVHDLKNRLGKLGNVNFMALEEFDKENRELEFMNKQIEDLKESEENLKETITEINTTAQKKFLDTFDEVNENFQMLFKTLFSEEGESQLVLEEGDPLESNVEIKAKPPGKRPHSIEMLSGGEKTLTAIALLFGIYLVKPSPFCILDEVDAPLDDANIDKYIKMIRKFSNNTQFLIVTHNKKTMEASDTLYGITMQEEGISKVVSVKLNQETL